ncbi:Disease resistance protein RPH8A [Carex littledalei]|uniref:Disease resistance protein RPH8A n=1 Tax=Carex littledalei TaxID=544730 RepID=A0A833RGP6_9POAL|nr:Disease resistance protein RPH8A [Carex littledalei]
MVQVTSRSEDGSIKYCRIHDLLRDLALQKAKEDNFLIVYSHPDDQHNLCMARRVAVHNSDCDKLVMSQNLRTLLCFRTNCMPNCSKQKLLKVVNLDLDYGTKIELGMIEGLTQLRYLNLGSEVVSHENRSLGEVIGNMKFLQTVSSINGDDLKVLPWHKELRHVTGFCVELPSSAKITNLQTLNWVRSDESWETELPHVPNLRTLDLIHKSSSWGVAGAFLSTLNHLISLDLTSHSCLPFNGKLDMRDFPFYLNLQSLELYSESKEWIEMPIDMPPHLTHLRIWKLKFRQDIMPALEKLQYLKELRLYSVDTNEKMCCSAKGFCQLEVLTIRENFYLKDWEIEEGAMPILKELEIVMTPHLRVPQGLRHLTNLQQFLWDVLFLRDLSDDDRAAKANEIRNLCKHVPLVSI